MPLEWRPDRLLDVLALTEEERAAERSVLGDAVYAVAGVSPADIEETLIGHLP